LVLAPLVRSLTGLFWVVGWAIRGMHALLELLGHLLT
jgi:hypothetical protein